MRSSQRANKSSRDQLILAQGMLSVKGAKDVNLAQLVFQLEIAI